jgi:hypothetical protein
MEQLPVAVVLVVRRQVRVWHLSRVLKGMDDGRLLLPWHVSCFRPVALI